MARIESGELGDKGREREWLARALRAPRDRAWIADGYISDRWLPISPVTGAVDAFEWKAPVDAIGRGDDTLIIEERPEPVTATAQVLAPFAPPRAEPARIEKREVAESRRGQPQEGEASHCRSAADETPGAGRTALHRRAALEARDLRAGASARRPRRGADRDRGDQPDLARALARGANPLKRRSGGAFAANLASLRQWP